MNYSVLALSSCGAKMVAQIGSVAAIYDNKDMSHIDTYIGTSGGSIICLLLNIGFTIEEIFSAILNTDLYQTLISNNYFTYENIKQTVRKFHTECGLIDSSVLSSHIKELMKMKLDRDDITFLDLHLSTGKELCIVASNIDKKIPMYFNYKNTPNLRCIDAVEMSCNIPLFFKAIRYNGDRLVDGALSDPFPVLYYDTGDKYILGINVREKDIGHKNKVEILDYGYKCTWTVSDRLDYLTRKLASNKCTIIDIEVNDPSVMLIKLTEDNKIDMYVKGYYQSLSSNTPSHINAEEPRLDSEVTSYNIEDIKNSHIEEPVSLPVIDIVPISSSIRGGNINTLKDLITRYEAPRSKHESRSYLDRMDLKLFNSKLIESIILPIVRLAASSFKMSGSYEDRAHHAVIFMKLLKHTRDIMDNMNIYTEEDKALYHGSLKTIVMIFLENTYGFKVDDMNRFEEIE